MCFVLLGEKKTQNNLEKSRQVREKERVKTAKKNKVHRERTIDRDRERKTSMKGTKIQMTRKLAIRHTLGIIKAFKKKQSQQLTFFRPPRITIEPTEYAFPKTMKIIRPMAKANPHANEEIYHPMNPHKIRRKKYKCQ